MIFLELIWMHWLGRLFPGTRSGRFFLEICLCLNSAPGWWLIGIQSVKNQNVGSNRLRTFFFWHLIPELSVKLCGHVSFNREIQDRSSLVTPSVSTDCGHLHKFVTILHICHGELHMKALRWRRLHRTFTTFWCDSACRWQRSLSWIDRSRL